MDTIYRYSSNKELVQLLDASKPVFVDTETSKLGSQIRIIQVYQEGWDQVLIFENPMVWIILQQYHLVGHNIIYDFGCFKEDLKSHLDYVQPKQWDDTFYLSRLAWPALNTSTGFSLDSCLTKVLGYDPYSKQDLNKKDLQMSFERIKVKGEYVEGPDGLRPLTERQLLYASIDVYELPHLYNAVKSYRDDYVYQLDIKTVNALMRDSRGMPVDLEELSKLERDDIQTIAHIKQDIGTLNSNSYMQVRKALGTVLSSDETSLQMIAVRPDGLTDHWFRIKIGQNGWPKAVKVGIDEGTILVHSKSFGKETPITHSSQLPRSNKILVYAMESSYIHSEAKVKLAQQINLTRKALKRLNFVKRAKAAMVYDDGGIPRIQAHFSPHAINGRIQQDNENLTQYPRAMKAMWGLPKTSGRKLMYSDYAQIELRIICAAIPEMNMYKALKAGEDLHSFVADRFEFTDAEIALLPVGQNPRQIAKQTNFLLLYGGGESNFQQTVCKDSGVWFDDAAIHKIVTKWKSIFSDITKWHKRNSRSTVKTDQTISGRRYKANTVTDLNNIRVSGTGSEVFKLWLYYIDKYLLPKYDIYIVNRVHDSVVLDVPDDEKIYKPLAQELGKLAQKAWFETIKRAPLTDVPMPVDVGVGRNFAQIEKGNTDYSFTLEPYYMMNKEIEDELSK